MTALHQAIMPDFCARNAIQNIERTPENKISAPPPAKPRLPIYLRFRIGYEKNCKSIRQRLLAGGDF
ncbi:MAG: hypothetical protein KAF27_11200 [Porphyrobacter sp.]|nr:hypothetical protein [Porphyrobacter sp.]